jgi:hypothetical protein
MVGTAVEATARWDRETPVRLRGHGFGVPYSPWITGSVAGGMALGGAPAANARAAAGAWFATRAHLDRTLD